MEPEKLLQHFSELNADIERLREKQNLILCKLDTILEAVEDASRQDADRSTFIHEPRLVRITTKLGNVDRFVEMRKEQLRLNTYLLGAVRRWLGL